MKTKSPVLSILGILAIYFSLMEFTLLTPAIDTLFHVFEGTSQATILMANTITGVVVVPCSILSGMFVNRIGYRKMAIAGLLIAICAGTAPYFMANITVYYPIIFSRIIVGVGLGMLNPLGSALISSLYEGEKRARLLGIGNFVFYFSGIVFQLAGGFLCRLGWNYTFLGYLIALISLVLVVLFLPEPTKEQLADTAKDEEEQKQSVEVAAPLKEKMPASVYGYTMFVLIVNMLIVSVLFLCSTVLAENNLGDSGVAGALSTLYTVGGMISGLIAAAVLKVLGRSFASVLCLGFALGQGLFYFGNNLFMLGAGIFITGFIFIIFFTAVQVQVGKVTPKSRLGVANGLVWAAMNLATFVATYYIQATYLIFPSAGTKAPMLSSTIAFAAIAVIAAIAAIVAKGRSGRAKADS